MLHRRYLQYFLTILVVGTFSTLLILTGSLRRYRVEYASESALQSTKAKTALIELHQPVFEQPTEKNTLRRNITKLVSVNEYQSQPADSTKGHIDHIANVGVNLPLPNYIPKLVNSMTKNMPPIKPRPIKRRNPEIPIYSSLPAVWPAPVKWPEVWVRPTIYSTSHTALPDDPVLAGEPIVCNMKSLQDKLRPKLPPHFQLRKFRRLPSRYSEIAEPRPQPYCGALGLLYPWKLIKQQTRENTASRKIWMLFVVKSAPGYLRNRMLVRSTWAARNNSNTHKIFVLFVLGKTSEANVTESVQRENEQYGDILECDFVDHYHKLPIKILSTFRWILERKFDVKFLTMTDDDCLVNLPNLIAYFDANVTVHSDYYKNVYCGLRYHFDALPSRSKNKWAVTRRQYANIFYPTFCHGGLWTLAVPLMHGIYCVSEITKIGDFFLEDVLLTGILREKLNFKETNIVKMVDFKVGEEGRMLFHGGYRASAAVAKARVMKRWKEWQQNRNSSNYQNATL